MGCFKLAFAASALSFIIGFLLGYEAGNDVGWLQCADYYKPMIERCRKHDAAAMRQEKTNG